MSAVVRYLPTANMPPLPRRANVGRLPPGIARFSTFKRARRREVLSAEARARQAKHDARELSERDIKLHKEAHDFAELVYRRLQASGGSDTFIEVLDRTWTSLRNLYDARGQLNPDGAA